MQLELVLLQDLHGARVRSIDELAHVLVHALGGARRAGERGVLVEIRVLDGTERHHAEFLRHTEARDHVARELRGLLDVVGGTGGHLTKDKLLGRATTAIHGKLVERLLARGEELLVFLHLHGVSERARRARHDGDLGDRRALLHVGCHDSVTDLVVRDDLLLVVRKHGGLALLARDDNLDRFLEVLLRGAVAPLAHGAERALVDDVGEICARSTGRGARDCREVDRGLNLHILGMELEDGLTAGQIGKLDGDAAVKAARAQKRRVKRVRAVRCREHDDALVVIEAVHLGEELVQGLLALVVGREALVTPLANGIDLVDEDDAGRLLVRLLEEVAYLGGTSAHEHLDELGARDAEERHACLAGNCLGEERLTGTRRAYEQGAARQPRTDVLVALRVLKEVDDLLERLLGLLLSRDVLERDAHVFRSHDARAALAEAAAHAAAEAAGTEVHRRAIVAHGLLHAAVQPPANEGKDEQGQNERHEVVGPDARIVIGNDDFKRCTSVNDTVGEARVVRHDGTLIGNVVLAALERVERRIIAIGVLDRFDLLLLEVIDELAIAHIVDLNLLRHVREQQGVEHKVHDEGYKHVEDHIPSTLMVVHLHRATPFLWGICCA